MLFGNILNFGVYVHSPRFHPRFLRRGVLDFKNGFYGILSFLRVIIVPLLPTPLILFEDSRPYHSVYKPEDRSAVFMLLNTRGPTGFYDVSDWKLCVVPGG